MLADSITIEKLCEVSSRASRHKSLLSSGWLWFPEVFHWPPFHQQPVCQIFPLYIHFEDEINFLDLNVERSNCTTSIAPSPHASETGTSHKTVSHPLEVVQKHPAEVMRVDCINRYFPKNWLWKGEDCLSCSLSVQKLSWERRQESITAVNKQGHKLLLQLLQDQQFQMEWQNEIW